MGRVTDVRLVGGPRARDAFILRMTMGGQWHVAVQDRAPLTVLTVLGGACVVRRGNLQVGLGAGDVAVISGTDPYAVHSAALGVAETLATQQPPAPSGPRFRVLPGQDCVGPDGQHVRQQLHRGVRAWGNSADGPDQILVGTYTTASAVASLSLADVSLTRVDDAVTTGWAQLLAREAERENAVQSIVLDRLLDILTVQAMHAVGVPGSIGHPGVAAAVAAMYEEPATAWTVDRLARRAAMSRSAFAHEFHAQVGTPPVTYLTRIRLALAADALRDTDATVSQIAHDVGYASPFALSNAFSREYGKGPKRLREEARAALRGAAVT